MNKISFFAVQRGGGPLGGDRGGFSGNRGGGFNSNNRGGGGGGNFNQSNRGGFNNNFRGGYNGPPQNVRQQNDYFFSILSFSFQE